MTAIHQQRNGHKVRLVIGYGNELRGDDGLGGRAADLLEALHLPGVRVLTVHQLTPELAEPISAANAVLFLDAALHQKKLVEVQTLEKRASSQLLAHVLDPAALLQLAQQVYGHSPPGFWIKLAAHRTPFRRELSPRAKQALAAGAKRCQEMLATLLIAACALLAAAGTPWSLCA
jgi:hydrogenase maturation protease